ncbi:MAG TPA: DUF2309 domain-containing protein [Candidatus Melainabacteria bacterium]|nr:DUF2309 domain-containing protein [Candidatus Melainabacteria bacterium]
MNSTNMVVSNAIESAIAEATNCIGPLYPLTNFIACNALKGFEEIPFASAMRKASELFGARGFLPLSSYRAMYESGRIAPSDLEEAFLRNETEKFESQEQERKFLNMAEMLDRTSKSNLVSVINKQMVKWCAAYLDRTQAPWANHKKDDLYSFWKELAPYDLSLALHGVKDWSQTCTRLPARSNEALEILLEELEVRGEHIAPYLRRHVVQMPGFASYLKWREQEGLEKSILTDYFAIRLQYEKVLSQAIARRLYKCADLGLVRPLLELETASAATSETQDDYGPVWQEAYELNYRNKLLSSLDKKPPSAREANCQLVFCIDVRSEPIRRELEKIGPYSTYGFAGFFGMAMRLSELGSSLSFDLCPVLLKPERKVEEKADGASAAGRISWQALRVSAMQLKKKLKCNLAGAFGLVEMLGVFSAVPLALKTFFPSHARKIWNGLESSVAGLADARLDLSAFSKEEKVAMAEKSIKGIGLESFGQLIVLCGHKSTSLNNQFASALDCGACGGNRGGYSARLAADVLNDRSVREELSGRGLVVPDSTRFIAAEHDTTTDQFEFFDCADLTQEQAEILAKLKQDLVSAGNIVRDNRARRLPQSSLGKFNDPIERSCDWGQTAPEWGLAGNAAFIAAPRNLSKNVDLEGRVFLHSYEYSSDSDGQILELIMTAPMVVAQWINTQYYLSTVDNKVFGSGSKIVHNVVGDFGVMQGAEGDLRLGLPLQSLVTETGIFHEPMRLLAVIRAPLSAIDAVLEKHQAVRKLVSNRWIRLVALDPHSCDFYEADDCGQWRRIEFSHSGVNSKSLAELEGSGFAAQ